MNTRTHETLGKDLSLRRLRYASMTLQRPRKIINSCSINVKSMILQQSLVKLPMNAPIILVYPGKDIR